MIWWSPLPLLLSSGMVKVRVNKGYDCLYCEGLKSYLHIIVHMNVRKFCVLFGGHQRPCVESVCSEAPPYRHPWNEGTP